MPSDSVLKKVYPFHVTLKTEVHGSEWSVFTVVVLATVVIFLIECEGEVFAPGVLEDCCHLSTC